jgi:CubicO group peptidase (beta-lactamase class C family)
LINLNDLEAVLLEIKHRWDIPGLIVGMVDGGEIAYAKGFGVRNLDTQIPMTLDSVFCVQSISKCFVATAVMQLVEAGKLELDAPLVQYLPYFQMDDERFQQITIRQALSHTSGMPDIDENNYIEWVSRPEYDDRAAERFVRSLSDKKLIADPGERFSYSNIAYDVLGDLLAKVSGKSFESNLQENILFPSGMPNSTFLLSDVPPDLLVWPHLRTPDMKVNPIYPYHRADSPASFLHTTVEDMCRWCITCLNRGTYQGQSILSTAGYERMWTPAAKRGDQPSMYEFMGLGWNLGHYRSENTVSHGGAGFGWTAFMLILPEKNSAAVVLSNEESNANIRIIRAVADTLLELKPQANTVSWMVPINRALAEGGIDAAYACYSEIKDKEDEFFIVEYDLIGLALQLFTVKKIDLAIDVLGLNIHVFPGSVDSYIERAKLYQVKGDATQAREDRLKAEALSQ